MADPITINFSETNESPTNEQINRDGTFSATRQFRCAYHDRITLAQLLLGTHEQSNGPDEYPSYADAIATSVTFDHTNLITDSDGNNENVFQDAIVNVTYATRNRSSQRSSQGGGARIDTEDGVNVVEQFSPTAEYITVTNTNLFWDRGGTEKIPNISLPGLLQRIMSWTVTMQNVPKGGARLKANNFMGSVNKGDISSFVFGAPFKEEAVLFLGAQFNQVYNPGAAEKLDIVYSFMIRAHSWNHFPRPQADHNPGDDGNLKPQPIFIKPVGSSSTNLNQYKQYPAIDFVSNLQVKLG